MSEILGFVGHATTGGACAERLDASSASYGAVRARPAAAPSERPNETDVVELSAKARTRATSVRADLVKSVRDQIANGTYLTPAKIDVAVDRLYKAIRN